MNGFAKRIGVPPLPTPLRILNQCFSCRSRIRKNSDVARKPEFLRIQLRESLTALGAGVRCGAGSRRREPGPRLLRAWPIRRLPNWIARAGEPLTEQELAAVCIFVKRGSLFGEPTWVQAHAKCLGIESTLRPRRRPQVRFSPRHAIMIPEPLWSAFTPACSPGRWISLTG